MPPKVRYWLKKMSQEGPPVYGSVKHIDELADPKIELGIAYDEYVLIFANNELYKLRAVRSAIVAEVSIYSGVDSARIKRFIMNEKWGKPIIKAYTKDGATPTTYGRGKAMPYFKLINCMTVMDSFDREIDELSDD